MKNSNPIKFKECFMVITLMVPIAAFAFAADNRDIKMLAETKINLSQAIDAAQKHNGGQAIEASLEDDSFKPAYEVSVVKDGRIFDIQVDGVSGEVLGSREDIDD